MKTFSFRAECRIDVERFENRFRASFPHPLTVRTRPLLLDLSKSKKPPMDIGEVAVEVETVLGLEYIRAVMREVIDSHVMLQSLRELPLADNTLERDHSIE